MEKPKKTVNPIIPTIRRLLKFAGPLNGFLYTAIVIDLAQAALLILGATFIRTLLDAVSAHQPYTFWKYSFLLLFLAFPNLVLTYFRSWTIGQFSERTMAKLRTAIAERSARLPVAYLEERHSGDVLSVLNADLAKLKTLLGNNLTDLVGQITRGVSSLVYIISINWLLALISTILTPAIFMMVSTFTKPVSKRSEEMQDEIGKVNSVAQDSLNGAMVVKSFNLAELLDETFRKANQKAVTKGMGVAKYWSLVTGLGWYVGIVPFIFAFGIGGYMVIDQAMTFGGLFAFINLLNYVVNPLGNVPGILASISEAAGAAQRIFALLDEQPERVTGSVAQPQAADRLAIQFDGVSFAYADGNPVLKDLHLDVPKGQTVAIVGPSGSGKSTALKLILGYYPLPDEKVRLLGYDLNDWKLTAARQQMAFVAQDTYLFPVSLGENIRCGRLGATQEEIERAARLANIHDFIAGLPEGYNTNAGEWGSKLSGGQKQRISLARAILKDAPILLLDEPTSALDTESEASIQEALDRFTRDRTTVVVAHRLSTIKNADRVLVLNDGEIVEEGTHDELIARGGQYLDLYQRQFALDQSTNESYSEPRE